MKNSRIAFLATIVSTVIVLSGCAQSLLYSPALIAPSSPLQSSQGQVFAGASLLNETRPDAVGRSGPLGVEGGVRYGFSDMFSLQGKAWLGDSARWGGSLAGTFALEGSGKNRTWAIAPTVAFVADHSSVEGGAIACYVIHWFNPKATWSPYIGVAPVYAFRKLSENSTQDGVGLVGNIGVTYSFTDSFGVTGEINGIGYRNMYDNLGGAIFSASIAAVLAF